MNARSNIALFLADFKRYGEQTAIIWHDKLISYQQIIDRIDFWKKRLNHIPEGSVVCIEGDFSPEAIAILFVLIEMNIIIVPLDIIHRKKNDKKYDIAQTQIIIRINSEEDVEFEERNVDSKSNDYYKLLVQRQAPGLVLFTSGSSGEPKAAVHDFSKLLTKFNVKRKALKTINFLLFDHWGGLNTMFHILSNGGTVVLLENRNPDYVCNLIEKYKVELLPTSPTFLNMLILSRAYERRNLESLKIISYGAEPMPDSLLKHLNKIFPNITLQQTYGLIELGVMRSKSEDNSSLWVKIGGEGFQTRVVDGILQVKSDSAMIGYLNADSPFTEDGWFITGDTVEVKGDYFKILGRKSELINVGGEKVFPQEVESVIQELDNVAEVTVFPEKNPIMGNIVCAKVKLIMEEDKKIFIARLKIHCKQKLQSFKIPVKVFIDEKEQHNERFKKIRSYKHPDTNQK